MKKEEIKVGLSYRNRGKGTTIRTVLDIGTHCVPHYESVGALRPAPEAGVLFVDAKGNKGVLYITSFAKWAGGVCE